MYNIYTGVIDEITKSYVRVKANSRYYYIKKENFSSIFSFYEDRLCYPPTISGGGIPVEKEDRVTFEIKDFDEINLTITAFEKKTPYESPIKARTLIRDIPWSENDFQLGASLLFVPPVNIKVERLTSTQRVPVIRSKTSIKQQSGHTDTKVTMVLYFPSVEAINDPRDGLRGIMAQFMRTPFVPVINTFLNDVHNIYSLCLYDVTVCTVPNFPGALEATVTCFAFDHQVFMSQEPTFINTIDADLFEWYISQETKENNGRLKAVTGRDSSLRFFYIPEDEIQQFAQKRLEATERNSDSTTNYSAAMATKYDLTVVKRAIAAFKSEVQDKYIAGQPVVGFTRYVDPDKRFEIRLVGGHGVSADYHGKYPFIIGLKLNDNYGLNEEEDSNFLRLTNFNAVIKCEVVGDKYVLKSPYRYLTRIEQAHNKYVEEVREEKIAGQVGREWELSLKPYDLGNVIVTSVAVSYQNIFSRIPTQMFEKPAYQFLGSQDQFARVTMEVLDDETMRSIVSLFEYTQFLAREYRYRLASSFLRVENEILNLLGMDYIFIDTMSCTPVPNFPGRYIVDLTLMDFNLLQAQREQGKVVVNTDEGPKVQSILDVNFDLPGDELNIKSGEEIAVYWAKVNRIFKEINVYPDLSLPTFREVNAFLASIGRAPLSNPKNAVYVDPDFYFTEGVGEGTMNDVLKTAIDGAPSVTMVNNEGSETVHAGEYAKWYDQGSPYSTSPQNWTTGFLNVRGAQAQWKNEWSDQLEHTCTGRMLQAFPVVYIFLVDEGPRIRWHKIWDNLYGLDSLTSVEIIKSRKIAADTAIINISNIYRGFTDKSRPDFRTKDSKVMQVTWPSITEDMKKVHNNISGPLGLFPGARLHIRMGYGNNLSELPIIFNGTVTEVDVQDIVTMVAQSDALELTNILNFPDGKSSGFFNTGSEPKNLLEKLLLWGEAGGLGLFLKRIKNFAWNAKNPVVHFGNPEVKFLSTGAGEIGQNIYPGNGTGFKEGQSSSVKERYLYCEECNKHVLAQRVDYVRGLSVRSGYTCPNGHIIDAPLVDEGGDEPNIEISLHGKTIWDIAQIFASAVPNYIASVQPFEFRSTLYYGKPHWDIVYGYELFDEKVEGAVKTESGYYLKPKTKPLMQWHLYTSFGNIIDNRIKVSSDGLFTNVIVQMTADLILGKRGATIAPVTVFADKDIDPHIQRTTMIDSQLYNRAPFPSDPLVMRLLERYGQEVSAENYLWAIGASAIRDYLKDMYRGNLVVMGDPSVKPYDAMYLNDHYNEMYGSCLVKQVVHTFSIDTGFTTTISPDAAVAVQEHEALSLLIWGSGIGALVTGAWFMRGIAAKTLVNAAAVTGRIGTFISRIRSLSSSARLTSVFSLLSRGAGWLSSTITTFTSLEPAAMGILGVCVIMVGNCLMSNLDRYIKSAQSVVINLLSYHGKEFSAGINGHRGITVGMVGGNRTQKYSDLMRNLLPSWFPFTPKDYELERTAEELFGSSLATNYNDEESEEEAFRRKGLTLSHGVKIVYHYGIPRPATEDDLQLLESYVPNLFIRRDIMPKLSMPDDLLTLAMIMEATAQNDEARLAVGSVALNRLFKGPYYSLYDVIQEPGQFDGYKAFNSETGEYDLGPFFEFSEVSPASLELAVEVLKRDTIAGRTAIASINSVDPYAPWINNVNKKGWRIMDGLILAYDKNSPVPNSEITRWINDGAVLLTREELIRLKGS